MRARDDKAAGTDAAAKLRERKMREAVRFLYDLPKFTKKHGPEHTLRLMSLLGGPCADRKVIHVAGSNGKGSVCSYIYHMLLAAGASAAMFTSPHLVDIRERFQINGRYATEEEFLSAYDRVTEKARGLVEGGEGHPTFFEFVYAMAMVIFEESRAEYIVLETGLGGRLDATNSFPSPVLSVITPISLEHTEILGDTTAQIASEKAGIMKKGVPVVFAADDAEAAGIIAARAGELGCPGKALRESRAGQRPEEYARHDFGPGIRDSFFYIDKTEKNELGFSLSAESDDGARGRSTKWRVPGHALYQAGNAALAIESLSFLPVEADDEVLQRGLWDTVWPGRMQEVLPDIWLDGAHNPAGIAAFLDTVRELTADDEYAPMLLFSMLKEKDIKTSVGLLAEGTEWDTVAVTTVPGERGEEPERTAVFFRETEAGRTLCFADCIEAFEYMRARRKPGQKLFCTGSLYFIGALTEYIEQDRA